MKFKINSWSILLICFMSLFVLQQATAQTIDFEALIDAGEIGPWSFDLDDTPCEHDSDCGSYNNDDCGVYAYSMFVWHDPARNLDNCEGSGEQSYGICTAEDITVLDGVDGVTAEFTGFSLSSFDHRNWCNMGQLGDHRVYTNGVGTVKVDGVTKLSVVNARITLDVYYPHPLGSGGLAGISVGSGWGTIDMDESDPNWVAEFSPNGVNQVEFVFGTFSPVVQSCWGAYRLEIQITPAPLAGDVIFVPVSENLAVVNVVDNGILPVVSGDVDSRVELNVTEFENGGPNEDMNAFMAIQVLGNPGGAPPAGIEIISPYCYWELGTVLASITADVTFDVSEMPGIYEPQNLRILWKVGEDDPWVIYPDQNLVDDTHVRANGVNDFSLWCIGSTECNSFIDEPLVPDLNLRAAIKGALGLAPGESPSCTDLRQVLDLNVDALGIVDLSGLEQCLNIQSLSLKFNNIEDISLLSGLVNLRSLFLDGNEISDVTPLFNLVNLEELGLSDNQIQNTLPLRNLANLGAIYLDNNQIDDIRALANFAKIGDTGGENRQRGEDEILVHLGLSGNNIVNILPLLVNAGISDGDGVDLRENQLGVISYFAILGQNILGQTGLMRRGVNVLFDPFQQGDAKTQTTMAITPAKVAPGAQTQVQLVIVGEANITAGDLLIKYDADVIAIGEIENADLTSDMIITINKDVLGEISISMAGAEPIPSGLGALLSIGLSANADAQVGTETSLEFGEVKMYNTSGTVIDIALEDGVIEIFEPGIKGDVNNDGGVRANDAIMALRIAVGMIEPSDYQLWAADINGDGKVAANDAIFILRKAANLAAPGVGTLAGGSGQITITLAGSHGAAGETISVPLMVDNVAGLAGGDICVVYDNSVLRAVDISSDLCVSMVANFSEPGTVRIAFAGVDRLNTKTLAEIRFRILTDKSSPLRLQHVEFYQPDALPVNLKLVDGRFRSWTMPAEYNALLQNFPNPFNPETWIPYQLKEGKEVTICIHNVSGEVVRELNLGRKPAGIYTSRDRAAHWDGTNEIGETVASGIYFYTVQAGEFTATRKMIILK